MYAFETLINFLTRRMYFIHNEYHHYNVRQHFINIGWSLQQSRKKEIYFVDWYMSDILNKLVIKIMCIVFFVINFYYNSIFEIRSVYPNTQQQTTTQYCFSWYNSAYSRLHFNHVLFCRLFRIFVRSCRSTILQIKQLITLSFYCEHERLISSLNLDFKVIN